MRGEKNQIFCPKDKILDKNYRHWRELVHFDESDPLQVTHRVSSGVEFQAWWSSKSAYKSKIQQTKIADPKT
jgi:hypothetical protein